MALAVLHDDAVVGGPELGQHPVLLVGELHFFSLSKDAADFRGFERPILREQHGLLDVSAPNPVLGERAPRKN